MLVFISWSGEKSRRVAEGLQQWLPQVIQAAEPWISTDIEKGARWSPEIADQLERSRIGIICLTRDNLDSKWILYEAGALSKTRDAHVCTLLVDVDPADVEPPLSQFQHTTATDPADVRKLLGTIAQAVVKANEKAPSESSLDQLFPLLWPGLESLVREASSAPEVKARPIRTQKEMSSEMLELLRLQGKRLAFVERWVRTSMLVGGRSPYVLGKVLADEVSLRTKALDSVLGKLWEGRMPQVTEHERQLIKEIFERLDNPRPESDGGESP